MIGIYKITNPEGEIYIGQTSNFIKRLKSHKSTNAFKNKLGKSMTIFGYKNHKIEMIEECNISELKIRERFWQLKFNSINKGLNSSLSNNSIYKGGNYITGKRQRIVTSNNRINGGRSILLDINTGVYYYGYKDAISSINNIIKESTLRSYLSGRRINKTNIILV